MTTQVVMEEVVEVRMAAIRLTEQGQQRRDRLLAENRCLGCEKQFEEGEGKSLGLCQTCYNGTIYRINKKKVTRRELIRTGELLEKGRRGRPPMNAHTKSLAERYP